MSKKELDMTNDILHNELKKIEKAFKTNLKNSFVNCDEIGSCLY